MKTTTIIGIVLYAAFVIAAFVFKGTASFIFGGLAIVSAGVALYSTIKK